jgi:hypothetical protein
MDCRMSEVIVTLDKRYEDKINDAVSQLKKCGLEVSNADDDNNVVEGTIDVCKVPELEKLDSVDYVRTVFTYDAEFPVGDPRDTNGM